MKAPDSWYDNPIYKGTSMAMFKGRIIAAFVTTLVAVAIGGLVVLAKVTSETSCNQRASTLRYGQPVVVGGDFRFWSNTCYLYLNDGRVIPDDAYRMIQETQ